MSTDVFGIGARRSETYFSMYWHLVCAFKKVLYYVLALVCASDMNGIGVRVLQYVFYYLLVCTATDLNGKGAGTLRNVFYY